MAELDSPADYCKQKGEIETHCRHHCTTLYDKYQGCVERIANLAALNDKDLKEKCEVNGIATIDYNKKAVPRDELLEQLTPKANCLGQYFDYFHCVDHCASKKLWAQLK